MFEAQPSAGHYDPHAALKEGVISAKFLASRYAPASTEQLGPWVIILLRRPRRGRTQN